LRKSFIVSVGISLLLACTVALAVTSHSSAQSKVSQTISEDALLEHTKLPSFVEALRPRVAAIMHSDRTTWEKATTVRNLLRAVAPRGSGNCSDYSLWFLALTRTYGLEARMAAGSLNMLNNYDTHTTVEVWLPGRHRWVIVDPTFGGDFTVGGEPIGAFDLQRLIRAGQTDRIHWKSSNGKNDTMPSDYYVDPVLLFRYVAVYGQIGDQLVRVANRDSRPFGVLAATTLSDRDPPIDAIRLNESWAQTPWKLSLGSPPWYATRRVSNSYRGPVVLVGDRSFVYRQYRSTEVDGRWVSPINIAHGGIPAGVTAYAVREFPRARES
jgi:hypothetical protein